MRKGLIALAAGLIACASASPPPGGPEDLAPPKLVRVTPDTNALNVTLDRASFHFSETINDRGTGAQEVDAYFLLSPSDGAARVSWHRGRIDVRPRNDFRPDIAYVITLLPGLSDLSGNKMTTGATVVFSTGASIPTGRIAGTAFDWIAERPAAKAYIEAVTPDSIVYLAQADSLGKFIVGPLPAGSYLVRAIIDQNSNRALDRSEAYDSVRVTVPQQAPAELLAAPRDTLPANLSTVTATDSVTLELVFGRALDPTQSLSAATIRIASTDSVLIPVTLIRSPAQSRTADSIVARARSDSTRRADSLAGRPLTPIVPVPLATPARGARTPPAPPEKPSRTPPFTSLTLKLASPLAPNTRYRVAVAGIRALSGRTQPTEVTFTTPRPPAPPAATPRDSATVRPPVTPPAARPPAPFRRD